MAKLILTNAGIFFDGYEIGTDMNSLALEYGADTPEKSAFGDETHIFAAGGLKVATAGGAGFFNAENADPALFDNIGAASKLVSLMPARTAGGVAYFLQAVAGEYAPQGALGEMLQFNISLMANQAPGLLRGSLLHRATGIAASGNGSGFQLGAVGAAQSLYAGLHVFAVAGSSPTLDAKIVSDDNAGFTTPTDRITFAQKTAVGAEYATPVAGPITDDYWRLEFTVGGSTPSFALAGVIAIQ